MTALAAPAFEVGAVEQTNLFFIPIFYIKNAVPGHVSGAAFYLFDIDYKCQTQKNGLNTGFLRSVSFSPL